VWTARFGRGFVPRCTGGLRSTGILPAVDLQFVTEVLGQTIGPILKSTIEDGTDGDYPKLRTIPEERRSHVLIPSF